MARLIGQCIAKISANAYASIFPAPLRSDPMASKYLLTFAENNVNAVTVQIRGSNDGVTWFNVGPEIALAKNATDYEVVAEPWMLLDPQVKSTVAETAGSLTTLVSEG
jgi:hypothetical protein